MCKLSPKKLFIERIINVWNFLTHAVDFSSLPKFKRSLNRVDFSAFYVVVFISSVFVFMGKMQAPVFCAFLVLLLFSC